MSFYVTFDSDELFFRPGKCVESFEEAQAIADANGWSIHSISTQPRRWVHDGTGFKPHFNIGLGKHVETRGEYYAELKKRNLIEVGNERIGKQTSGNRQGYISDEAIRAMNEMGAGFSDGDVRELREG